jgi:hypothetical protein
MIGSRQNSPLRIFAACALLFLAAQALALSHSLDHEKGISQSQACATCVAANHMSSSCVDHTPTDNPVSCICHLEPELIAEPASAETVVYRQRGPPSIP